MSIYCKRLYIQGKLSRVRIHYTAGLVLNIANKIAPLQLITHTRSHNTGILAAQARQEDLRRKWNFEFYLRSNHARKTLSIEFHFSSA